MICRCMQQLREGDQTGTRGMPEESIYVNFRDRQNNLESWSLTGNLLCLGTPSALNWVEVI